MKLKYFSAFSYIICMSIQLKTYLQYTNKLKAPEETIMINIEDFDKIEMRAGTILDVKDNKKSRNPAYVVTIDFGEEIGIKKSSAQITTLYKPEDLIGRQIICCVNLTPIHIGSVKSEVRILGTESEQGVVLLQPSETVKNGDKIF